MADILLKRDSRLAATYVPNTFIDEYMTHADGEFVKIYLYLLRCMDQTDTALSISDIADQFDHTEKDVIRALRYWEKMHLLKLEFNSQKELTGIFLSEPAAKTPAFSAGTSDTPAENTDPVSKPAAGPASLVPERMDYTKRELAQFNEDETVKELLFVAERYLARTLNDTEMQIIIYWLDKLKLSQDMIDYLIEQCVAKNHKDLRYMNKIAVSWAEHKIHTLDAAKKDNGFYSKTIGSVKKAFGISGRNLAGDELTYIKKWSDELGFSDELISLACGRTINKIHQISFDYADKILTSWNRQNVRTKNDVQLLDAQYQESRVKTAPSVRTAAARTAKGTLVNGFTNFSQRTYNFEELERELLTNSR